jgi:hypothetical protein
MSGAHFLFLICFVFVSRYPVTAQIEKKKHSREIKLIEAYSQKTIAGIPRMLPDIQLHFIVIWEGMNYPESFFWRGENGWLTCSITKAHKITNEGNGKGTDYNTEYTTADKIQKGDTLVVTPIAGGKFPVPIEIPAGAKNILFYKTGGSDWLPFEIKNIIKRPDIFKQ